MGTKQWIDSLCIQQDSLDDWHSESPLMADVYKGSLCNIGATSSQGSDEGFFFNRDPVVTLPFVVTTSYNNPKLNADYLLDYGDIGNNWHEKELDRLRLFSRGWVFQERMLSPRMLSFGERVFWNCKTRRASEKYPDGYGMMKYEFPVPVMPATLSDADEHQRYWLWNSAVTSYSSLNLTFVSDKLVAISAVARHLQSSGGSDRYVAGLVRELVLFVNPCF